MLKQVIEEKKKLKKKKWVVPATKGEGIGYKYFKGNYKTITMSVFQSSED